MITLWLSRFSISRQRCNVQFSQSARTWSRQVHVHVPLTLQDPTVQLGVKILKDSSNLLLKERKFRIRTWQKHTDHNHNCISVNHTNQFRIDSRPIHEYIQKHVIHEYIQRGMQNPRSYLSNTQRICI